MKVNANSLKKRFENMQPKVIKVTKTDYMLENGDIYEHQFEIDENITVEEFQKLLDNAKFTIVETLNKINKDEF